MSAPIHSSKMPDTKPRPRRTVNEALIGCSKFPDIYHTVLTEDEEIPKHVTHVIVCPSVWRLREHMFRGYELLEEVKLPEGLEIIESGCFSYCTSLKFIDFPSCLRVIDNHAFFKCQALEDIDLPDDLEYLGAFAFAECELLSKVIVPSELDALQHNCFSHCHKLCSLDLNNGVERIGQYAFMYTQIRNARIPSSVTEVETGAFSHCERLLSLEVPLCDLDFDGSAIFIDCRRLRNIALNCTTVVSSRTFDFCYDLLKHFQSDFFGLVGAIRHRFVGLPVYRFCYYQSYDTVENTIKNMKSAMLKFPNARRQDVLGMTPLHILSLSTKQDIRLYQVLLQHYPMDLCMCDVWGARPIHYAASCMAPPEILRLLVRTERSMFSRRPSPKFFVQGGLGDLDTMQYMVQLYVEDDLEALPFQWWRDKVEDQIEAIPYPEKIPVDFDWGVRQVFSLIDFFKSKEMASLLELALWKSKILQEEQLLFEDDDGSRPLTKKAKLDGSAHRINCRMHCGVDVVVPNVLAFLGGRQDYGSESESETANDSESDMSGSDSE